jgi:EamA domain-containing membrane protein RarD
MSNGVSKKTHVILSLWCVWCAWAAANAHGSHPVGRINLDFSLPFFLSPLVLLWCGWFGWRKQINAVRCVYACVMLVVLQFGRFVPSAFEYGMGRVLRRAFSKGAWFWFSLSVLLYVIGAVIGGVQRRRKFRDATTDPVPVEG